VFPSGGVTEEPEFPHPKLKQDWAKGARLAGGIRFQSKKEAYRWRELLLLEKAGTISELRRQTRFPIELNGEHICDYVADFDYREGGKWIVEDTKGAWTDVFRLKYALIRAAYAGKFEMRVL
jgi:hypothetical protein